MKFNESLLFFSSSRIDRYHNATGKIELKTIELYKANLTLSKYFHPLLGIFEVLFRNIINEILSNYFNDPNWIINQKSGFMIDPTLTYTY